MLDIYLMVCIIYYIIMVACEIDQSRIFPKRRLRSQRISDQFTNKTGYECVENSTSATTIYTFFTILPWTNTRNGCIGCMEIF